MNWHGRAAVLGSMVILASVLAPAQQATAPVRQSIVPNERYAAELDRIAGELELKNDKATAARLRSIAAGLRRERSANYPVGRSRIESPYNPSIGRNETNYNPGIGRNGTGTLIPIVVSFQSEVQRLDARHRRIRQRAEGLQSAIESKTLDEAGVAELRAEIDSELARYHQSRAAFLHEMRNRAPQILTQIDEMMRTAHPDQKHALEYARALFANLPKNDDVLFAQLRDLVAQSSARWLGISRDRKGGTGLKEPK